MTEGVYSVMQEIVNARGRDGSMRRSTERRVEVRGRPKSEVLAQIGRARSATEFADPPYMGRCRVRSTRTAFQRDVWADPLEIDYLAHERPVNHRFRDVTDSPA